MGETDRRPTLMASEMSEQPEIIARLLGRRRELGASLASLRAQPPAGILLAARGSSDHAATYGRYLLEAATGAPAALSANSLFTRYRCRTRLTGWLVVAISQSGATPEVCELAEAAAALGATTLALTNDACSPLAESSQLVVEIGAGEERAVPATKTYTATLAALALVAESIGEPPWRREALEALPEVVAALLAAPEGAGEAVRLLTAHPNSVHLGRGYLYGAALESALKLRETARTNAEAYSSADFLHGPIAASTAATLGVVHVGAEETRHDGEEMLEALLARHAPVVEVGERRLATWSAAWVPVPRLVEPLAPFAHAVVAQQLALGTALALGVDPDRPEGLEKVTATS